MGKEICVYEIDKHCNIVRSRELNGKKTIMYIWYFNINRDPDGMAIKHKSRPWAHGGMQQWGVNHCETYFPVVKLMSIVAMLTLSMDLIDIKFTTGK